MPNFYDGVIRASKQYASASRIADPGLLEPCLREAVVKICQEADGLGHPLLLFETYRSKERQAALYKQRATQLPVVGVHHYGLAVDLVKNVNGDPSWKGSFDFLGVLAVKYRLVWGGNWKGFPDACHLQRIAVADQQKLFSGAWYPAFDYDPL